jgi:hypothetical protein
VKLTGSGSHVSAKLNGSGSLYQGEIITINDDDTLDILFFGKNNILQRTSIKDVFKLAESDDITRVNTDANLNIRYIQ